MEPMIITSEQFAMKLCQALDIDFTKARRLIVDCQAGEPVQVYVEMFGNEKMLDVDLPTREEISLHIVEDVPNVPIGPTNYGPMMPPVGTSVQTKYMTEEEMEQTLAKMAKDSQL